MNDKILEINFNESVPTLNTLYRTNKFNKVYKSAKAKQFTDFFKEYFTQANIIDYDIKVEIIFNQKRDCDIDSKLKVLLDAMQGVIYKNDIQIQELTVKKYKVKNTEVKTTIIIYKI